MVRWLMIVLSLLGLFLALTTRSPGVMGLSLVMLVVGLFGIVLSVAAGRIGSDRLRSCEAWRPMGKASG